MLRLQSDFVELCKLACAGQLEQAKITWDPRPALGVVMASRDYPDAYAKGEMINGLTQQLDQVKVFHAGTKLENDKVVTAGGRVLCVTAIADDLQQAQNKAYQLAEKIHWGCEFYRHDIGFKAL